MHLITYTLFLIFTVIFNGCEDSIDMSQFNENFCELNSLALLEPTKEFDFIEYRAARRQESMTTFDTLSVSSYGEAKEYKPYALHSDTKHTITNKVA